MLTEIIEWLAGPVRNRGPIEERLAADAGCPTPRNTSWAKRTGDRNGVESTWFELTESCGEIIAIVVQGRQAGWIAVLLTAGTPVESGFQNAIQAIYTVNGMLQP